jgi:hypothetical protein
MLATKPSDKAPAAIRVLIKSKKTLPPIEASVFKVERFVQSHEEEFLRRLWTSLCERLASTSLDIISSLKDEVMLVLESMKPFNHANVSLIEESLETLFACAAACDDARSVVVDLPTQEVLACQLKDAEGRLEEALNQEAEGARQVELSEAKLKDVEEQLELLTKQQQELVASLGQQRESLRKVAVEVGELHGEIIAIQSTEPSDGMAAETLRITTEDLAAAKDVLEGLNPFA